MPIEQALTPDDLSAMRALTVPDVWPPIDCPSGAELRYQQPAGLALPDGRGRGDEAADGGQTWSRQFALLLAEALTGDRPVRQILPWLSPRGRVHLHQLRPLFCGGQGARVQRVMTTRPAQDVIEMTLIVVVGPRIRALAVRLTLAPPEQGPDWREKQPASGPGQPAGRPPGWLCTDIEAA
jgi:Family of unknown function (DUF6459)